MALLNPCKHHCNFQDDAIESDCCLTSKARVKYVHNGSEAAIIFHQLKVNVDVIMLRFNEVVSMT